MLSPVNERRSTAPLEIDLANRSPFCGVPSDFPSGHSCFPITPSSGYGDLSFEPSLAHNARPEESSTALTADEMNAWRASMSQAFGKLDE
ncbi:MAG TPA: hypothetical protein VEK79_03770 [Thermoanaerobaculia bacterium]|nr:hypothetical protein [Thermoanaerobaculia bacterium]